MQYDELIQDIFSRHPSVQVSGFGPRAYKAGLEAMEVFDSILGSPWKSYPCIHVAGTNGKGSTSSMIAASLAATGKKTGLYTSPHLLDFRERMKLILPDGTWRMISKEDVQSFLEAHMDDIEKLSFFEITTGMALWWFAKEEADCAVIEVGLGGMLDSTNIISPEISVVTSIGLDHCALLGSTREEIALQKAGIFKKGCPAVVWGHDPQTDKVFEDYAERVGARLVFADEAAPAEQLAGLTTDLQGEYQQDNIRTASCVLGILGITPDPKVFETTAQRTGLRGRWEKLSDSPLVICDIGHNPPALAKNFRQLEESGRELAIVYGVMADKALDDIAPLMPSKAEYYLCSPKGDRALPVEVLKERLSILRPDLRTTACSSVEDAVRKALTSSGLEALIYIGGSTFVVSEAIPLSIYN